MLSDEVKSLYISSQDSMNRTQLDSRNSIMRIVDFYDKISAVFNSAEFLPQTKPVPDLHEDFSRDLDLPLKEYRLTSDKAKDLLVSIRPKLSKMTADYELSGAGEGQMREEDNELYGTFDANRCENGDDRRNFCHSTSDTYLLYWWHRLDEEGFLQFTVCALDKFQRANAEEFSLVSRRNTTRTSSSNSVDSIRKEMVANVKEVGEGVKMLSYTTLLREIEAWEEKVYDMNDKLLDLEQEPQSDVVKKRGENILKRIGNLNGKITETKRRCSRL